MLGFEFLFGKLFGKGEPKAAPNPNAKAYFLGIGLNRVNPNFYGGWNGELTACVNDTVDTQALVQSVIPGVKGQTLVNDQATMQNVANAYAGLAAKAMPGDLVIIQRSGHGGQERDESGDEADKLDETLCLYDGQVLDDTHAYLLSWFRAGVRVLLITDTCHSQTMTRFAPSLTAAAPYAIRAIPRAAQTAASQIQRETILYQRSVLTGVPIFVKAGIVSLTACKDSEVAYDGQKNGAFTGALLKAWGQSPKDYEDFIKRTRKLCTLPQTPQLTLEGAANDAKAFAKQKPFTL